MKETMGELRRTHGCGEVTEPGMQVVVGGFVQNVRNKNKIIFIVLRDRTGAVQMVFDENTDPELFEKAASCRSEYVLLVKGTSVTREAINPDMPTGRIEIRVEELRILAKADPTPFLIMDEVNAGEELRLKYRYLDLRRAPHKIAKCAREYFYAHDFIEIETPMMMRSTPEGARDYLIPSRVHPGEFYALPQSPQLYKQLLMVAGMERYIQIARCFRDEDLRADRQPEFTQIDLEMSYVDMDDILTLTEGFVQKLVKDVLQRGDAPSAEDELCGGDVTLWFGQAGYTFRYGIAGCVGTGKGFGIRRVLRCGAVRRQCGLHRGKASRQPALPQGDRQTHGAGAWHRCQGACLHSLVG